MKRATAIPGWLPLGLLVAGLFALQVWCFHWGVITPDTVVQYGQVLSGQYEDWHPPVTAWVWRQLTRIAPGSAPFLLFEEALYWGGILLIAERLRRQDHPIAALLAIGIAALPIPFGQMAAILKDPLLTASLLLATGLLATGAIDDGRIHPAARVAAVPLIVLAAATRFNAVEAAAPILLLAIGWPRRGRTVILGIVGCAVLLTAASWAVNSWALRPKSTWPIISVIGFDLAGIAVRTDTGVYPETARPDIALLRTCYADDQLNRLNRDDCNGIEDALLDDIQSRPNGAIKVWLGAVTRHPLAYLEHRLGHFNWNQRWLVHQVPNDAFYVMNQPNDLGLSYTEGAGARWLFGWAGVMAESPLGRPATWLAVALGLLIVVRNLRSQALVSALAASALLYGLGYAAISVAPDLRYNLWTMLAAMLGLLVAGLELPRDREARRDALLAAVPVIVVVAGELVAMAA